MSALQVTAKRLPTNPMITPESDARIGLNINGPSLIRAPGWVADKLGAYYLYFAHHRGSYIRLATADHIAGPWRVYSPGVLDIRDSHFTDHIASPDVHIDHDRHLIWMYYHGFDAHDALKGQTTRVAVSRDGLSFHAQPDIVVPQPYLRVFRWRADVYGLSMLGGMLWRSHKGLEPFELMPWPEPQLPTLERARQLDEDGRWCGVLPVRYRHGAVWRSGSTLMVVYSMAEEQPERLVYSTIDLTQHWHRWTATPPLDLLRPEELWEGVDLPLTRSSFGEAREPVHQLRDPAIFEDDDRALYLAYSIAGERGIAIAQLHIRT
jgi:hypothetical protein